MMQAKETEDKSEINSVALENFLRFVFPSGVKSPHSWGALKVFVDFGPCNEEGFICGGFARTHPLSKVEINTMIKEAEEEIKLGIFVKHWKGLSKAERTDVLEHNPVELPRPTVQEVMKLIKPVKRTPSGRLNFDSLQQVVNSSLSTKLKELILKEKKRTFTHIPGTATVGGPARVLNDPAFTSTLSWRTSRTNSDQAPLSLLEEVSKQIDTMTKKSSTWNSYSGMNLSKSRT